MPPKQFRPLRHALRGPQNRLQHAASSLRPAKCGLPFEAHKNAKMRTPCGEKMASYQGCGLSP